MANDDDDKKKVTKLLEDAHAQGSLSAKALASLDIRDVGAQIQAGLGVTIDDIAASEVVLVTMILAVDRRGRQHRRGARRPQLRARRARRQQAIR